VQESHHHHVEGQGASAPGSNVADCQLCDTFCTGLCRLSPEQVQPHGHVSHVADLSGLGWHDHGDGHVHHHGHGHGHHHGQDHGHDHAHPVYPHADHPLGPVSALKARKT
jgi:sirohydrochlorin cobaltochelatase